jgi:hypothetical protein
LGSFRFGAPTRYEVRIASLDRVRPFERFNFVLHLLDNAPIAALDPNGKSPLVQGGDPIKAIRNIGKCGLRLDHRAKVPVFSSKKKIVKTAYRHRGRIELGNCDI